MAAATSLIPGLQDIVRRSDPKRRATVIRSIATLFVQGAEQFGSQHIELFDSILTGLLPQAELAARIDMAERFAALAKAPPQLVHELAHEDHIAVAGPLLRASPLLSEAVLIELARSKGQEHLLAIAEREEVSAAISDVVVRRGERDVVRRLAGNAGAQFSQQG